MDLRAYSCQRTTSKVIGFHEKFKPKRVQLPTISELFLQPYQVRKFPKPLQIILLWQENETRLWGIADEHEDEDLRRKRVCIDFIFKKKLEGDFARIQCKNIESRSLRIRDVKGGWSSEYKLGFSELFSNAPAPVWPEQSTKRIKFKPGFNRVRSPARYFPLAMATTQVGLIIILVIFFLCGQSSADPSTQELLLARHNWVRTPYTPFFKKKKFNLFSFVFRFVAWLGLVLH